jgi:predicted alpha-1,2-mannosidase
VRRGIAGITAFLALAAAAVATTAPAAASPVTDPAAYVDPLIGTRMNTVTNDAGMTFPGAVAPFGMLQWSPDTERSLYGSGYDYDSTAITGFSLTHLNGAGCLGFGEIPIMPVSGAVSTAPPANPALYRYGYTHAAEQASPGYYGVQLTNGPKVELAATQRSGTGRLTFPAGNSGSVLFDVSRALAGRVDQSSVTIDAAAGTVSGYAKSGGFCGRNDRYYTVYFSARFSSSFSSVGTWNGTSLSAGATTSTGSGARGGYVSFANTSQPVVVKVGLSFTSPAGAVLNRTTEGGSTTFDQVRSSTYTAWKNLLGRVTVDGGTEAQRKIFYTSLYHTLIQPNVFSDVDGRYAGFDLQTRQAPAGHTQYANFSGWDTYRTQVQLMTLIAPQEASDVVRSMLANTQAMGGVWDRWSLANTINGVMNGDPFHSIVASTYAFGGRDFDTAAALSSMVRGADQRNVVTTPYHHEERPGLEDYHRKGYVPDQAADTVEYAVADFGIASFAQALGDQATYTRLMALAQSWESLFSPLTASLQPRDASGAFYPNTPSSTRGWSEGSTAQYTWAVPYNRRGLFDAMGGNAAAVSRLDRFFKDPSGAWRLYTAWSSQYAHLGNEPSQHAPWLYNFAGAPYKTQETLRQALLTVFSTAADGLPGNDDLGTTSSWWAWGAMGLYPSTPGRSDLTVAAPLFTKITIARPGGTTITINAPDASDAAKYVTGMRVNGTSATSPEIPAGLVNGNLTVDFTLSTTPNQQWGAQTAPKSYQDGSTGIFTTMVPADRVAVPRGGTGTAQLAVRNTSATTQTIPWAATTPAGVTFTPSSGSVTVPPGQTVMATMSVAATAADGFYKATVTTTVNGVVRPNGVEVAIGPASGIATARNSTCIGTDGISSPASCDLSNHLYSANALAAAGIRPGNTVNLNGFSFTWPTTGPNNPYDNVVPVGQTITLPGAGVTRLSLLGASVEGNAQGQLTVTYTDGTTQSLPFALTDWARDPQFGEAAVVTAYRLENSGNSTGPATRVFATPALTLTPGKTLRSITLPQAGTTGGEMHIFAIGTG